MKTGQVNSNKKFQFIHEKWFTMRLAKTSTLFIPRSGMCIYVVFLPLLYGMVLGLADMDLDENITLAQCRAACLLMVSVS